MKQAPKEVFILGSGFSKAVFSRMPLLNDLSMEVARQLSNEKPIWKRVYDELVKFGRSSYGDRKAIEPINFEELLTFLYQDFPWKSEEDAHLSRSLYLRVVEIATEVIKKYQRRPAIDKRYVPDSRDVLDIVDYWHYNQSKVITLNYDTILEHLAMRSLKPWLYKEGHRNQSERTVRFFVDVQRNFTSPEAQVRVRWRDDHSVDIHIHNYEVDKEAFEQALMRDGNDEGMRQDAAQLFNTFTTRMRDARLTFEDFYNVPIAHIGHRTASVLAGGRHEGTFELLKLHGSINWFHSGEVNGSGQIYYLNDTDDAGVDWSTHTKDLQPLIIPPVLDKSRFFVHNSVKLLWNQARDYLENAKIVYIIGYSIPLTDLTVRLMLQNYLQHDCRVVLVNKDVAKLKAYGELFGSRLDETYIRNDDNIFVSFVQNEITQKLPPFALEYVKDIPSAGFTLDNKLGVNMATLKAKMSKEP